MTAYYKSYRIIGGRPKWVITDEYGKIVDIPTNEQMKTAIIGYSPDPQIRCCICNSDKTSIDRDGYPVWRKYKDEMGNWDKKSYSCHSCYMDIYNKSANGSHTMMRLLRSVRTGNIYIYGDKGKGLIVEMVVAKVRRLKNINIETDNFNSQLDLSCDNEYGRPQIKGPSLIGGIWKVHFGPNFDHIWIVCMDKNRKNVKRIYIIPCCKLANSTVINIYEDWSRVTRGGSKFEWVEEYRIDEFIKDIYNDAYHSLLSFLGDKKYFGIDDIKKWMEL